MLGNQIENYKIISLLGEGGMANVYLAQHQSLGNNFAIKFLKEEYVQNSNIRKRFLAEARNLAKMSHPNIIKVTNLIDAGDIVAFVMEYIEGQTLEDFLLKKGKLTSLEIEGLFNQMILAVEYVHGQGLIHRDIKPSNFMVTKNGQIKLLDFGIAKNTNEGAVDYTKTGLMQQMGTPMYMSPEQVKNTSEVTKQTDIYSLGVVLWQMVTGQKPYDSVEFSLPEIQVSILKDPLPVTNTIWDQIIEQTTEKDPIYRSLNFTNKRELDYKSVSDTLIDTVISNPNKKEKSKLLVFLFSIFIGSFFIYFLNKDDKTNKKVQYVLISEINLRSKPFKSSKSLLKIPQADSVLILGDSAYSFENGSNYKWKKCKYIDSEGWVSTEIDGQKNLGNKDLAEEFKILMANIPNGSYEYHDLRTIFFHGLIDFLKEKGLDRKYSFAQNQYNNTFQTIQKFNFRNNNRVYDCRILLNPINEYDYPLYIVLKLDVDKNKIFVKEIYGWKMLRKVKFFKVYNNDIYVDLYDVNEKYIGTHSDGEIEKL
jgi:serine/threonine protein kinase